uniref:Uncharacterized protein n=1 Tax=Lepeophtheirus salmonis TaxID=72036 RepID=A0A0K2UR63_LEPSM
MTRFDLKSIAKTRDSN